MVSSKKILTIKWAVPSSPSQVLRLIRSEPDVRKALLIFDSASGEQSSGYRHDHSTFALMASRLAASGQPRQAESLLSRASSDLGSPPSEFSFIPLLRAYSRAGLPLEALRLLRRMASEFLLHPSRPSYNAVLSALVSSNRVALAMSLFREMRLRSVPFNAATFNILLHALCSSSSTLSTALRLFQKLPARDACAYGTLIAGLCKHGRVDEARKLFDEMPDQGCPPNVVTFTSMIHGLCRAGQTDLALRLLDEMPSRGVRPNAVTYTSLIDGLCKHGRSADAARLMGRMAGDGCSPNTLTYSALVNGLCGEGRLQEAADALDAMRMEGRRPDAGLYGKLIKGLCESRKHQEAANCLDEMVLGGVVPNRLTWSLHVRLHNMVIRGLCGDGGKAAERAFRQYLACRNRGVSVERETYGLLVDCLCGRGEAHRASGVVDEMIIDGCLPDSSVWGSVVGALCDRRNVSEETQLVWDQLVSADDDRRRSKIDL